MTNRLISQGQKLEKITNKYFVKQNILNEYYTRHISRSVQLYIFKQLVSFLIDKEYRSMTFSREQLLSKFSQKLQILQQAQSISTPTSLPTQARPQIATSSSSGSPNRNPILKMAQKITPSSNNTPSPNNKTNQTLEGKLTKLSPAKDRIQVQGEVEERKQNKIILANDSISDAISKLKRQIVANAEKQQKSKQYKKLEATFNTTQERKLFLPGTGAHPNGQETKVKCPPSPQVQIERLKDKKQAIASKRLEKQSEAEREAMMKKNGLMRFFTVNNFPKIEKSAKTNEQLIRTSAQHQVKQNSTKNCQPKQNCQPFLITSNNVSQHPQQVCQKMAPLAAISCAPKPIENFIPVPEQLPIPYQYLINNLLSLSFSKTIPADIILLYMNEVHIKHSLPYASIVITFGVEYLVAKFYEIHDLQLQKEFEMNGKYIIYYLDFLLPDFIILTRVTNWNTICEIGRAATYRFGKQARKLHNNDWVYFAVCRKQRMIKEAGVDLGKLLQEARTAREKKIPNNSNRDPVVEYDEGYLQSLKKKYNYTTLNQYLVDQKRRTKKQLFIQEPNEQILAEAIEQQGISKERLYEYKNIRECINPSLAQQTPKKIQFVEEKQYEEMSFEILKLKFKLPPDVIIEYTYKNSPVSPDLVVVKSDSDSDSDDSNTIKQLNSEERPEVYSHVAKKSISNRYPQLKMAPIYSYDQEKTDQYSFVSEKSEASLRNKNKITFTCRKTTTPHFSKSQIMRDKIKQMSQVHTEQILKKMDELVSEFHERKPEFNMDEFLEYLSKILTEVIKVPTAMHEKLTTLWMSKYCE